MPNIDDNINTIVNNLGLPLKDSVSVQWLADNMVSRLKEELTMPISTVNAIRIGELVKLKLLKVQT